MPIFHIYTPSFLFCAYCFQIQACLILHTEFHSMRKHEKNLKNTLAFGNITCYNN